MKTIVRFVALVAATLAIFATACALGAGPKKLGAPLPHRVGAGLDGGQATNDSGIVVDEAGVPSIYLGTAAPSILGEPPIDHCNIPAGYIDFNACTLGGRAVCGSHVKQGQGQLTPAQCNALFNALVAALADAGVQ